MKNITQKLDAVYLPQKALVIYQAKAERGGVYVEAYDIDRQGQPINAHPLSVRETIALAECLNEVREVRTDYLSCIGLLPERLLSLNPQQGYAVWYTPSQMVNLLFTEALTIPCGTATVPALVWKADRKKLQLFALHGNAKPKGDTPLYEAPFFNVYEDSVVCMGTVDRDFTEADDVSEFMAGWEHAFWNSYFSHLIGSVSPVKGNIIQLWQGLVDSGKPFPSEVLVKKGFTLNDLMK